MKPKLRIEALYDPDVRAIDLVEWRDLDGEAVLRRIDVGVAAMRDGEVQPVRRRRTVQQVVRRLAAVKSL